MIDYLILAAVIVAWYYLRDREKRRWIEKNFFAGWKNHWPTPVI